MKKEILIITDYKGAYRQDISRSQGIELDKMKDVLKKADFIVEEIKYNDLLKRGLKQIKNKIIVYTSSENIEYKEYIKDIMYELAKENVLVPRYDLLMCHEDKIYQEILKESLGIYSLDARIYATLRDIEGDMSKIKFPIVIKKSVGAGSISVYKANNEKELKKKIKKMNRGRDYWEFYAKALYKKVKGNLSPYYFEDEKYFGRYVLQEFVPDLENDWKVLVFGNKYYALKREVRKKDFRASGSGKFSFEIPEIEVLDYAKAIYEKMDVPFLSLDLCMDRNKKVYLIEFQGLHFGPYTLIRSPHYFVEKNGWEKIEKESSLAETYGEAIIEYLKEMEV